MSGGNVKKVAKNAMFLYIRTGVSIIIQLFAVRYLLLYLGSEGYGLYGLIGSIVVFVESLKGTFSTSLQRFINIERGNNNINKLQEIFNVGLRLYAQIGLILTVITIIVGGISFIFLDIPQYLQAQAYVVLVLSAITMGIGMVIIPYDALIVAYERFLAYALLAIISSVLKLAIVLVLIFVPGWRIAVYALLLFGVTSAVRLLIYLYCKKNFKNIITKVRCDNSDYKKQIMSLTGFRGIASIGVTLQTTGINYLLNMFGGLVVNAARAISGQVLNAVNVLVYSTSIGFNPRCLTLWGEGDRREFFRLLFIQSKICYLINAVLGFVISLYAYPILKIWLDDIPEYTTVFIQTIFLYTVFRGLHDSIDTFFNAIGKVRVIKSIEFTLCIASIFFTWLLFKLSFDFYWAMLVMVIAEFATVSCCLIVANKTGEFPTKEYFKKIISRSTISLSIFIISFFCLRNWFTVEISFINLLLYVASTFVLSVLFTLPIVFNKAELFILRNMLIKLRQKIPSNQ